MRSFALNIKLQAPSMYKISLLKISVKIKDQQNLPGNRFFGEQGIIIFAYFNALWVILGANVTHN